MMKRYRSLVFGVLAVTTAFALFASPVRAVRFGNEDDDRGDPSGGMAHTPTQAFPQPSAGASLESRAQELLAMAKNSSLAALISNLSLFGSVINAGAQSPRLPEQRAIVFLDRAADVLAAQFPGELGLELRQMYFYREHLSESPTLWMETDGHSLVRTRIGDARNFQVEVSTLLHETPVLQKIHRLIAMVEVGQSVTVMNQHPHVPYRSLAPIVEGMNQITSWLLVEELLMQFDPRLVENEIRQASLDPSLKSALIDTFTAHDYLDQKALEWMLVHRQQGALSGKGALVEWVKSIREMRKDKALRLGSEESLTARLVRALRRKAGLTDRGELFRLASEARAAGDERTSAVIRELFRRPLICEDLF